MSVGQYFRNIYDGVATTLAGMRVTLKYMRAPVVTLQYPDEKAEMFDRFRGLLHNRIEDCIGCGQCVRACPVDCITMVTNKAGKGVDLGVTRDGTPKKLHVYQFDIDTLKCMWCNLCTEVCPTECLTMSSEYEVASEDRDSWTLRFAIDTPPDDFDMDGTRHKQNRRTNPVEFAGELEAAHAVLPEGAARPLSGAAEHDFNAVIAAAEAKKAAAEKAAKAAAAKAAKEAKAAAAAKEAKPAADAKAAEAKKPAPAKEAKPTAADEAAGPEPPAVDPASDAE